MHLVPHTVWSLVAVSAYLGAIGNAADDVLDIGIVFPRQNVTYAPQERFPIVFALQNAELAKHLQPLIEIYVWDANNTMLNWKEDLVWANYSTEPYLVYAFPDFETESPFKLRWTASWRKCDKGRDVFGDEEVIITWNNTRKFWLDFNLKQGAQKADLVAATAKEETCSPGFGVALNVTDETHDVPELSSLESYYSGTCAVVASSSPTLTSNPCKVNIDKATVESMEANELERRCSRLYPPPDCPEEDQAIQHLAVAVGATFAAAFGAAAFLLA